MTASWVKPAANAKVKTYQVSLSAKTAGTDATEVAFKVEWSGGSVAGCTARALASDGTWSCTADLLRLGVPPGALKVSFDVLDATGRMTHGLAPDRSITYAVVPPRPQTTYRVVSNKATSDGGMIEIDKITWTEPAAYATEFRLYGVMGCLNESEATNGQPCVVEHMSLPTKSLKLLKKVGGTTRSIVLKHTVPPDACGPTLWCSPFDALVLGAYNAYGQSVFAIPVSTAVCFGCTY